MAKRLTLEHDCDIFFRCERGLPSQLSLWFTTHVATLVLDHQKLGQVAWVGIDTSHPHLLSPSLEDGVCDSGEGLR